MEHTVHEVKVWDLRSVSNVDKNLNKAAFRRSSCSDCSPCFLIPRLSFLPRCEFTAAHSGLVQLLEGSPCELAYGSDLVQDHHWVYSQFSTT